MNSLVSVIIPTYARPVNLCRAIESVLNQTYSPIEIIVVDDNGKGTTFQRETEEILKPYITNKKISYIIHEINKNGSAARNTGFYASNGEFINFVDDDDTLAPQKIEFQVKKLLEKSEEYGACYCWRRTIRNGKVIETCRFTEEGDLRDPLMMRTIYFNTTAILFRRKTIEDLSGFDESFIRHQDWELLMRMFRKYKIAVVSGLPLMDKNLSDKPALKGKDWFIPVKEKFINTFFDDINSLSHSQEILYENYIQCCINAAGKLSFIQWFHYLKESSKYGHLKIVHIKLMLRGVIKFFIK